MPKFIVLNRKDKKRFNLILIVFIAFITLKIVLDAVTPIFDTLCENRAISIATIISNDKVSEVMKTHTYDELFTIDKDEKGNVSMLKANVVKINEITSDVAIKIQEEINKKGREDIEIPLRKFYRFKTIIWKRTRNKN